MSRSLRKALKPFAITGAALALLVALGQPLEDTPSTRSLLGKLEHLPVMLALNSTEVALQAMQTCDAATVLADEDRVRERAELVKTALRMRWMITSFGGGSRGNCTAPDCTG